MKASKIVHLLHICLRGIYYSSFTPGP